MKAYKQCLLGYVLDHGNTGGLTQDEMNMVWEVFKAIEADAEKRFNPSPLRQAVSRHAPAVVDELPTIQVDEDLVEDIPF